mmetsp:Transcript_49054/g.147736  ORF Transcript_49054/g.147736 Transcript_49054/m.147736 type:complete len:255 (+) Transcript_49054:347-1111(+)
MGSIVVSISIATQLNTKRSDDSSRRRRPWPSAPRNGHLPDIRRLPQHLRSERPLLDREGASGAPPPGRRTVPPLPLLLGAALHRPLGMLRPRDGARCGPRLRRRRRERVGGVARGTALSVPAVGEGVAPRHEAERGSGHAREGVPDEGQRGRERRRRPRVSDHGRFVEGGGSRVGTEVRARGETPGIGAAVEGRAGGGYPDTGAEHASHGNIWHPERDAGGAGGPTKGKERELFEGRRRGETSAGGGRDNRWAR